LPRWISYILTRHRYTDAARQFRTAPTKLRKRAESMQKTGGRMSNDQRPAPTPMQRIRAVLDAVRGSLTDAQIDEVESNVQAGELVLALEFLVDFLLDNDATVPAAVNTEILTLLRGYGSNRAREGLPVA
jgi:hypothetical protein